MGSLIRICAFTAAGLVFLSFAFFAVDQLQEGSENQVKKLNDDKTRAVSQAEIDQPSPPAPVERVRETQHSSVRELVDDANDVLLAPMSGLVDSDQIWTQRFVPALLGLLLFGLGGGLLANAVPKKKSRAGDWRERTT